MSGARQVTDADLAAARTALKGKYPRDLINDALGTWLTERAQVVTSAVFVKVIANVRRRIRDHGGAARQDGGAAAAPGDFAAAEGGDGEGGEGARRASHDAESGGGDLDGGGKQETGYYRSKAILAFRCLPGSVGDALTFGMYVHEYGVEAPAAFRGKVLLECIDGTPLFNGETADERQRCLSAIAQVFCLICLPYMSACLPSPRSSAQCCPFPSCYTSPTRPDPRLHYRLLTLCPAPTDPVGQSWPRGTGSVGQAMPACI